MPASKVVNLNTGAEMPTVGLGQYHLISSKLRLTGMLKQETVRDMEI